MKYQSVFSIAAFLGTSHCRIVDLFQRAIGMNSFPRIDNEVTPPNTANSLDDAPNWALTNITRKLPKNNEIWMGFHITSEGYDPKWCYMLIHVSGDAKIATFADEPCVGSDFFVSWGYAEDKDIGIMTLMNSKKTKRSWFGWNSVNDSQNLKNVGPNPTEDIPQ